MPALYNLTALVPTPLVTISRQMHTADDGTDLGQVYQITLHGNLIAVPPGDTPVEEAGRLGVLLAKQNALTELFSSNGKIFEVFSPDGTNVIKCNPKVNSIEFSEGIWVDRTEYTIVLESPTLFPADVLPTENVSDISDKWQIEEAGFTTESGSSTLKPVWQLTHTVSATGKLVYDENGTIDEDKVPWKQARDWVIKRLSKSNFDAKPFNTKDELNLEDGGQGYNHTRTEEVDIVSGSFSVSEQWIMALGSPATEDYTISIKRTPEDQVGTTVTVNGTVHGLSSGINQLHTRIDNAITYFNASVKDKLIDRARSSVPDIVLSDYGVTGSLDYNYSEGSISYVYDFNDRITPDGNDSVYDNYTVSKKTSMDEIETTVTVSGVVTGRLKVNEPPSVLLKYERAKTYWDAISNGNALLSRANQSGVSGLKPSSLQGSVDFNFTEGTITYSYDFNNRADDTAKNEYTTTIKTTREEARTVINIEGSIIGLRQKEDDPITKKYENALTFWSMWEPQILGKATDIASGVTLNIEPASKTRGDNPRQGVINYNYEYNTDKTPKIPHALSEQITISDTNPSDVFAVIPVLGRLEGPILQDIGSKKEKVKSITLEVVMKLDAEKPVSDGVINMYKPSGSKVFLDRDEETWTENTGRYTRTVSWVYE